MRPRLAALGLSGLLLSQTLVPCGLLLSSARAADLRASKKAANPVFIAPAPMWAQALQARALQERRARNLRLAQMQNAPQGGNSAGATPGDAECLDCEVDLVPLNLAEVPTEKALRRAGGAEGALYPMRRAEPAELGLKLDLLLKQLGVTGGLQAQLPPKDPRFLGLARAKGRFERARAINTLFGRAMKAWNAGNRAQAVQLFGQYLNAYPKSPWSGEALLHLGYDAKENGRLAEAFSDFDTIEGKTADKPNQKLRALKRARRARGGGVSDAERAADIAQAIAGTASVEEAVTKLDSSDASDDDDESFEVHQKAKQQLASLDLLMGRSGDARQKLRDIARHDTNWHRRTWASNQLQDSNFLAHTGGAQMVACGPQALGAVLVGLHKGAQADKVRGAVAPRAQGFSLAELKTLAAQNGVPMRGFRAQTGDLAALPLPAILHYDFGAGAKGGAKANQNRASGHFVVLQGVDGKGRNVRVYDPLGEQSHRLTYAQLEREWSGKGLALAKGNGPVRLAALPLDARAMRAAIGGARGTISELSTRSFDRNVGGGENGSGNGNNAIVKGSDDHETPVLRVNRVSLNLNLQHAPLWYAPARGPAVDFRLSYNSQDSSSYVAPLGNKWTSNYMSRLAVGSGKVTVYMGDGSGRVYSADSAQAGRFNPEVGDFSRVEQQANGQYALIFQDGSRWFYSPNAPSVALLVRMQDAWGLGLDFGYDSANRLSTITDADGRVTRATYTNDLLTGLQDPLGHQASFSYDSSNNLVGVTDMAGQGFQYAYNADKRLTSLVAPQQQWSFDHKPPGYVDVDDGSGDNSRVTVNDPLGNHTEFCYDFNTAKSWSIAPKDYVDTATNNSSPARVFYSFTPGNSTGDLPTQTALPDNTQNWRGYDANHSVNNLTDERGQTTTFSNNAQGQPTSQTDPRGDVSVLGYAPNGVDVTSATNANGIEVFQASYNAAHQPTSTTDVGGTTSYTYTSWGAPDTIIDAQGNGTRCLYNAQTRLIETQHSDAPTGNAARAWQTLGSYTYDSIGRVATATDAAGLTMGYQYDALDQITAVLYPDGTRQETTYLGNLPIAVQDRSGRTSYYAYDADGRLTQSQDAQGNTLQMAYDKNGNQTSLTDSKGNLTQWSYDTLNRATGKRYHDGTTEAYAYAGGLLSQTRGTRGQVVSYSYDENGNTTLIHYPNMADVSLSYNALDQVSQVNDGVGTHTFNYDDYGRLLSQSGPFANDTQSYSYDALQRLSAQSVGRGASGGTQSQSYAYDALGRLSSLNSNGTQGVGAFAYHYIGLTGMLSRLDMPNGTHTTQSYDSLQRLTSVANSTNAGQNLDRYAYAYSNRDVRTGVQMQHGGEAVRQVAYAYDGIDQLTGEQVTGGAPGTAFTKTYAYDAMGNRTQTDYADANQSVRTVSASNALNQLTGSNTASNVAPTTGAAHSYDAAGNLTQTLGSDGSKTLYTYDDADRLTRLERRDPANVPTTASEWVYDYASRKPVSREFSYSNRAWTQTSEKRRVFDGMDVVQERNANNEVTAQLVRSGNIGGILSRSTGAGASFFGYDGGGNVTLLTDSNGAEVGHYRYDAFGNTLEASGTRAGENPYRFSTKELGSSGLYDFGYRFYLPSSGIWLNRDPSSEAGGINLYAMVNNNPINYLDEDGLMPVWLSGGFHVALHGATGLFLGFASATAVTMFSLVLLDQKSTASAAQDEAQPKTKAQIQAEHDAKYIADNWSKQTYSSPTASARDHFNRHPGPWANVLTYTRKAVKLWKNRQGLPTTNSNLSDGSTGVKVKSNADNVFGIYTQDGKIVSFGVDVE